MEDTLRAEINIKHKKQRYGLNPCFNGRYSQSRVEDPKPSKG